MRPRTPFIIGATVVVVAWAVIIFTCAVTIHRRRRALRRRGAGQLVEMPVDLETGRSRPRVPTKPAHRDFSPVPAYHRRESYLVPAFPAAVHTTSDAGVCHGHGHGTGTTTDVPPPSYSAAGMTDTSGGGGGSSGSSGGGNTSSSTTC